MELIYFLFPLQIFTIALVLKTYSILKKHSMCKVDTVNSENTERHDLQDK